MEVKCNFFRVIFPPTAFEHYITGNATSNATHSSTHVVAVSQDMCWVTTFRLIIYKSWERACL